MPYKDKGLHLDSIKMVSSITIRNFHPHVEGEGPVSPVVTPHPPPSSSNSPHQTTSPHLQGTASCLEISTFSTGIEQKPKKVERVFFLSNALNFALTKDPFVNVGLVAARSHYSSLQKK